MPLSQLRLICAPLVLGLLAGCGSSESEWAIDTCKTLPAEAAGTAAGVTVTEAKPGSSTSGSGTNFSDCTYTASDGSIFTVSLNEDTTGTRTVDQWIAAAQANPEGTDPLVEVPAPSGKALWNARLKVLSYYPDDPRAITVTPPGALKLDGGSDPDDVLQARALAIAEAAAR